MSYIELNKVSIYYEVHTPSDVKNHHDPIILLNGIMMNTSSWAKQLPAFSATHQIILHDFRGQGQSTLVNDKITFNDHVEDLRLLLDHLKCERVHLVGTSYGSEVGMSFALKHPERVQSLTIAAGVSESDALLKEKIRCWQRLAKIAVRHQTKEEFFLGTIASNFSAAYIEEHANILAQKGKAMVLLSDDWFKAFDALCDCFLNLNITNSLTQLKIPTLIVAGTLDELKPISYSKIIHKQISNSKLLTVEAGHALILERAHEFNEIVLSFLEVKSKAELG